MKTWTPGDVVCLPPLHGEDWRLYGTVLCQQGPLCLVWQPTMEHPNGPIPLWHKRIEASALVECAADQLEPYFIEAVKP